MTEWKPWIIMGENGFKCSIQLCYKTYICPGKLDFNTLSEVVCWNRFSTWYRQPAYYQFFATKSNIGTNVYVCIKHWKMFHFLAIHWNYHLENATHSINETQQQATLLYANKHRGITRNLQFFATILTVITKGNVCT